jgi:hypothetical protein
LGRNLRIFPTDFGRNYVFGRISDRKGAVRKGRVANNSFVPNFVPNIFQTDFARLSLWDIGLKLGRISDGIKFNFLQISDGIKLKFPTHFGRNFQTELSKPLYSMMTLKFLCLTLFKLDYGLICERIATKLICKIYNYA